MGRQSRREERSAVVERYLRSGQKQRDFCESEGVATSTLQYWLKRSREEGAKFRAIEPPPRPPTSTIEVVFPDGTAVRIRGS